MLSTHILDEGSDASSTSRPTRLSASRSACPQACPHTLVSSPARVSAHPLDDHIVCPLVNLSVRLSIRPRQLVHPILAPLRRSQPRGPPQQHSPLAPSLVRPFEYCRCRGPPRWHVRVSPRDCPALDRWCGGQYNAPCWHHCRASS